MKVRVFVLWILIQDLKPSDVLSQASLRDCGKGCEYVIPAELIRIRACGRDAMCRWDLKYYHENQPGAKKVFTDLGIDVVEIEARMKTSIGSIRWPQIPFDEPHCAKAELECFEFFDKIFAVECKRISPETPKIEPPPPGPNPVYVKPPLPFNGPGWHYGRHYLGNTLYNTTNFIKFTCPVYPSRLYEFTYSFLLKKNNVPWNHHMALVGVAPFLQHYVILKHYCMLVRYYLFSLYLTVSNDIFCREYPSDYKLICVNTKAPLNPLKSFSDTRRECNITRIEHPGREAMVNP